MNDAARPFADTVMYAVDTASGAQVAPPLGADRYERKALLGAGGMGCVHFALDRQFGRNVALKELRDATSPGHCARFELESVVTANLEHPGIPSVHERGLDAQGKPFYAMRLVQGQTLSAAICEANGLAERLKLLPAVVRVAQTLAYAHERGVVHRDIKPDNVVIGRHGETVVLDWGIAKVRGVVGTEGIASASTDDAASEAATRVGVVVGTPAYMAPEQAAGRPDEIDERTDVFALGALLYHVLSGKPPFQGPTLESLVSKAKAVDCSPIESLEPAAPPVLAAICRRAMARRPTDRFRSANEMADALEGALAEAFAPKESRTVRAFASGVSLLALLLGIAGTGLAWRMVTLADLGYGAFSMILFAVVAGIFSILELATRGRYRLGGLALVFTLVTIVGGVLSTAIGALHVLRALGRPEVLADPLAFRSLATEGSRETLGNLITGTAMGMLLLILWAIVQRALARGRGVAPSA